MTYEERSSVIKMTFGNEVGQRCLDMLVKTFIDRSIYVKGETLESVAYRQGQADLVKQLISEVKNAE